MKNENLESLMEQLELEICETYGPVFLEEMGKICGINSKSAAFGKAPEAIRKRNEYVAMLRGAWYASHEQKKK